jgi:hypothetical protein
VRSGARRWPRTRSCSSTVKGGKAGDKIAISWVDNKGDKRTDEATVS